MKKNFIILGVLLVLAAAGGAAYFYFSTPAKFTKPEKAQNIALAAWKFIDDDVMNEDRRTRRDLWINRFICNEAGCRTDRSLQSDGYVLSSLTPPALYISDLKLLASTTGNADFKKKYLAESLLLMGVCARDAEVCRRGFTAIASYKVSAKDAEKLGLLIKEDTDVPDTLLGWNQKLERYLLLAKITGKIRDVDNAEKVFREVHLVPPRAGTSAYTAGVREINSASCYRPLGEVRTYALTEKSQYLESVLAFAKEAELGAHAKELDRPEITAGRLIHPLLICSDLLVSLFEATGEEKYINEAKDLVQYAVSNNISADGAFYRPTSSGDSSKYSWDTLWFVNLLLRMPPGAEFNIRI